MNHFNYKNFVSMFLKHKLLWVLSILFAIEFMFLALAPKSRADWLLENVLVFVFLILVLFNYKKYSLSKLSWLLIFIFLCIHEIGAHYTYSEVPYDDFFNALFNFRLNDLLAWNRNHFDRLAHFAYGLFMVIPFQELCSQISRSHSNWTYFVAVNIVMSTSLLFELFEWGAAWLFGGELGIAYLGTQGDVWDAHQDMLLSILGALLTLLIRYLYLKIDSISKPIQPKETN